MLIIYRTNVGFEGDIVSLDFETPAAAMDIYLAQSEQPTEISYIEIAEESLEPQDIADLIASVRGLTAPGRFYVADVDGAQSLIDGGT